MYLNSQRQHKQLCYKRCKRNVPGQDWRHRLLRKLSMGHRKKVIRRRAAPAALATAKALWQERRFNEAAWSRILARLVVLVGIGLGAMVTVRRRKIEFDDKASAANS
jgi:hypothetical protein